ncbi:cytochrome P450 [Paenibacillus sp. J2TS4]|uniref:cytochrome P450 n=1 Tax=Paenibacillus sp. J2TS4 TaxID=2807194 RepID=UPI001AFE0DB4|nr:cytochrome P450 [Paenibacillus sp. J2TS4]GIP35053.1 biotin biosynthesis cytochrome P450 [Paenibacillus sp. J2TS4]
MNEASRRSAEEEEEEVIFQPNTPEFFANPHLQYRALRLREPVYAVPDSNSWLVTRYDNVVHILKDGRFGKRLDSSGKPKEIEEDIKPAVELLDLFMLFRDPPDHTRLRGLVSKAFTPRMIDTLVPRIQAVTNELLEELAEREEAELVAQFAFPLPVIVIAEMLGVPAQDRQKFKDWSNLLARLIDYQAPRKLFVEGSQVVLEITEYLKSIIAERRLNPQNDLISGLIRAEENDQKLTENELIASCVLLLVAGHETTVNLIANGVYTLLTHPEQLRLLQDRRELLSGAIEEVLRYESPIQMTSRLALTDVTIGGRTISRGQEVLPVIGAANRDPEIFADPDRFDITRQPNLHLAFAAGIHYCLGAALARAEGQVAIGSLLRKFPRLTLADQEIVWREMVVFRSLSQLKVSLSR